MSIRAAVLVHSAALGKGCLRNRSSFGRGAPHACAAGEAAAAGLGGGFKTRTGSDLPAVPWRGTGAQAEGPSSANAVRGIPRIREPSGIGAD